MSGRLHASAPGPAPAESDFLATLPLGRVKGYAFAVTVTLLCLAARLTFMPWPGARIMLLMFLIPVMLSAYVGGLGPGLLSSALATLAVTYFLAPPVLSFDIAQPFDVAQIGLLLVCGVIISLLLEALHRGRRRDRQRIEQLVAVEKRLRDAARDAAQLRVALDEHAIVAITDPQGKILFANDRFCALSGYSREELLGQDHRLINSGHHPKEFFENLWRTIHAGRVWRGEVKNRAKNGSVYWVDTTIVPFLDAEGAPHRFIAIRTDITAHKLADEEVERQRTELQILFDLNPAMIWFKDTENNHLRVNRRAAEAVGLPVSKIEGRPAAEVYPEDAARFYVDDLEVIRSRQPKLGIVEKIHGENGRELWLETNKVPYCDASGKVRGIVVTAQDVTERRNAEEALRQSEERFRQLAETVSQIFWIADPSSGRVLYVSPAFETIFGRPCAWLCENPDGWLGVIHEADRERMRHVQGRVFEEPYNQEFRIVRPDGEVRWIRDRGYPVRDAAGRIHRLVGTAEDITVNRRLQEQLLQAQKMEAIGTLAGGIAHDFNNILGGIIGYTELAKMRAKNNPALGEHLDAVLQASRRAANLVRQILAFSRRQETRFETLQLRHLIAEAMKLLRASIPATIQFDISLASDAAPVRADPTQIHQVVLNLCSNAEHAMRGHPGRLGIRLENVAVDEAFSATHPKLRPGPHVRLTVSDTGHGMSRDMIARIFEPFFTTKPPGEGSGLGLSVVHGVMESHHGLALVESAPGEGTRFELYFPAERALAAPPPCSAAMPARGSGEHILFVDDEASLTRFAATALQELGYRATALLDPAEALELLRAGPDDFDLVLVDHTMPGMTGIVFAESIRRIRPDLPVVLMTGHCADLIPEQARAAGVKEVLFKPLELGVLGETLKRHLSARPPAPAPTPPPSP